MGANSKIEWTDHSFNPWRGCAHKVDDGRVHPACEHCYAEAMSRRNPKTLGVWGEQGTRVMAAADYWRLPHKWNAAAAREGVRRRVFCASLADVFEDWQGPVMFSGKQPVYVGKDFRASKGPDHRATLDDVRRELFTLIDQTPWLDWLLLTKRPENVRRMWIDPPCPFCDASPCDRLDECSSYAAVVHRGSQAKGFRRNVWLGTSISDQATADRYVPELLKLRDLAPVLFLSIEPLLGPVDLWKATPHGYYCNEPEFCVDHQFAPENHNRSGGIRWVIVGGESGPHARPMHPGWVRSMRDQCQAAGVPFFFKQWGEFIPEGQEDLAPQGAVAKVDFVEDAGERHPVFRCGKNHAGRSLDGRTWDEVPEVVMHV